jgi:hypothetical protein
LRFNDTNNTFEGNPLYEFNNTVVLNIDPAFQDSGVNNFNIEQSISGAEGIGGSNTGGLVPIDLNGTNRATPPDAGAYESIEFPPEG